MEEVPQQRTGRPPTLQGLGFFCCFCQQFTAEDPCRLSQGWAQVTPNHHYLTSSAQGLFCSSTSSCDTPTFKVGDEHSSTFFLSHSTSMLFGLGPELRHLLLQEFAQGTPSLTRVCVKLSAGSPFLQTPKRRLASARQEKNRVPLSRSNVHS